MNQASSIMNYALCINLASPLRGTDYVVWRLIEAPSLTQIILLVMGLEMEKIAIEIVEDKCSQSASSALHSLARNLSGKYYLFEIFSGTRSVLV